MRYYVIISIVLFSCYSCTHRKIESNDQTKKIIILPKEIEKKTETYGLVNDTKLKYVIYIDGDCGSCIEKIFKWKELPKESPLILIPKIYIVGTSNIPRFEFMMEYSNITFDYYLDSLGVYLKSNEFNNSSFHTLLLDKDNIIIAFGDPFYSKRNLLYHENAIKKHYQ